MSVFSWVPFPLSQEEKAKFFIKTNEVIRINGEVK